MIDRWVNQPVWDWIDGAHLSTLFEEDCLTEMSMVDLEDIDRLLCSTGIRSPFFSLSNRDAGIFPFEFWRFQNAVTGTADSASILNKILGSRTTLIIKHAHLLMPKLAAFASILLRHRPHLALESNCYLTPPGSAGVFPHADARDTVLIQQFGSKQWQIWNSPLSAQRAETAAVSGQGIEILDLPPTVDVTLKTGGILYIPKACVHASRTQDVMSMHVTFGLRKTPRISTGVLSLSSCDDRNVVARSIQVI